MDNTFEALQDLYDIIEKCERRNVLPLIEPVKELIDIISNRLQDAK